MAEDYAYINPETGQLYAVHGYPGYQYHIYQDGHVVRVNGPTTNETIAQYEAAHMPTATPVPVPVAAAPAPAPAPAAPPPPANTGGTAAPTPPSNTPDMKNYTPKWNPGAAATSSYVNPADHNDVFEIQNASYTPGHEGEWHVYKDRPPVWVAGNPSNMHYETLAQSQASQSGGAPTVVSVTPQPTTGGTAAPAPSNGTGGTAAPTTPPSNGTGGTAAPTGSPNSDNGINISHGNGGTAAPNTPLASNSIGQSNGTGGTAAPAISATSITDSQPVTDTSGVTGGTAAPASSTYTVAHGDTLSGIAATNNVPLSELEKMNPQISDPNFILPGQQINLGSANSSAVPASSSGGSTYTVVHGDTLSGIAATNNVPLSELEKMNPQISDPNFILPGQQINLGSANSSAVPASSSGGSTPSVTQSSIVFPSASSYQSSSATNDPNVQTSVVGANSGWSASGTSGIPEDPVKNILESAGKAATEPKKT